MHAGAVGYSGVLFAYAALESYHTTTASRSFYGCFELPSKVYPWLLLVAIQVVLPNVSFVGHLAGMVFGLLLIAGLDCIILPSAEYMEQLESSPCLGFVYRLPNYVRNTGRRYSVRDAVLGEVSRDGACSAFCRGATTILGLLLNVLDTLLYMLSCPSTRQICERMRRVWGNVTSLFSFAREEHSSDSEYEARSAETTPRPRTLGGMSRDRRGVYSPVATSAEVISPVPRANIDRPSAEI